jgi:hypothetical protein
MSDLDKLFAEFMNDVPNQGSQKGIYSLEDYSGEYPVTMRWVYFDNQLTAKFSDENTGICTVVGDSGFEIGESVDQGINFGKEDEGQWGLWVSLADFEDYTGKDPREP